jgi:mannose-6-phosphate isomerase
MKRIEKPWGYEIIWTETEHYVGKLLHIKADHRLSKQYHEIKEETVYVLSGLLYNWDEDDLPTIYPPGASVHVRPKQIHRFGAKDAPVELIEVSTPHLADVVRLDDDYSR